MSIELKDKHVLITGGTRGIGESIAAEMNKAGAIVSITGTQKHTDKKNFDFYKVDFSDRKQVAKFTDVIKSKSFDVLVNNAGINKIGAFKDFKTKEFDQILDVNLRTPFLLCQAVLPFMLNQKWGRIINISSIFGVISKEFRAPYSATKFGLDGMTVALAAEVAKFGILANCIAPGFTRTDLTNEVLGEQGIEKLSKMVPARRIADPVEIARLAVWLASNENSYISGQTLTIDGGFTRV